MAVRTWSFYGSTVGFVWLLRVTGRECTTGLAGEGMDRGDSRPRLSGRATLAVVWRGPAQTEVELGPSPANLTDAKKNRGLPKLILGARRSSQHKDHRDKQERFRQPS